MMAMTCGFAGISFFFANLCIKAHFSVNLQATCFLWITASSLPLCSRERSSRNNQLYCFL